MNVYALLLAVSAVVRCELNLPPNQYTPNNNVNYVLNPDQSFTGGSRPALYTPYGFYGPPVNHPMDIHSTFRDQQQMKVKKDINGANSGGSLLLDDIR